MLNCRNTNMSLGPFVRLVCACGGVNWLQMLGGHPCQSEAAETFGSCERSGRLKGRISVWASPPTSEESIGLQHADPTVRACSVPGISAHPVSSSVILPSSRSLSETALLQE